MCMLAPPNATEVLPGLRTEIGGGQRHREHVDDDVLRVADGGGGGEDGRRDVWRGHLFISG